MHRHRRIPTFQRNTLWVTHRNTYMTKAAVWLTIWTRSVYIFWSGLTALIIYHQFVFFQCSIFWSIFLQGHGSKFETRPSGQLIFALPLFFLPSTCPQLHALSALCLTLSHSSPSCLQYSVLSPMCGPFFCPPLHIERWNRDGERRGGRRDVGSSTTVW